MPRTQVPSYKNRTDYSKSLNDATYFLGYNQGRTVLQNLNIRKALGMVINRENIASKCFNTNALGANYLVPKEFVYDSSGNDFRTKYPELNKGTIDQGKGYWSQGLKELGVSTLTLKILNSNSTTAICIGSEIKSNLELHYLV